jgi:CBS-domain-containing membrane protein
LLGAGLIVSPVYTCDLDDRAGLVMAAMSALKINAVAATDAKNLFKGVLSTHALLSVPDLEDLSLSVGTFLQKVENEEQEPVLTCGPRDSVAELLKKFASGRAHRVFVLDHKVVIGVITLCSLFRCMFDATVTHQNGNMAPVNILK